MPRSKADAADALKLAEFLRMGYSKRKNLLHRIARIQRFSIPHSTGQTKFSKAGTVLDAMVEEYRVKVNVREYRHRVIVMAQ